MKSAGAAILDTLELVLAVVQDGAQDLTWQSRYSDKRELLADLTDHAERVRQGDLSRLADLRYLFVPTGPLCEIAASSGWLDVYTMLGNRFDEAYERMGRP